MPQTRREVVKERARRLREKGEAALRRHLDAQVGSTHRVLAESDELGRTEQFTPVRLSAGARSGAIVEVAIVGHDGCRLLAA
jgi:threonylcarbamoyladenosine tRNA methylthiotransferase MtaB